MKKEVKKEKDYFETVTDKVGEIATHYGFTVIKTPEITNHHNSLAKQFKDFDYYNDAEEKVCLASWYIEAKLDNGPQPVAVHYKKGKTSGKKTNEETYGFEIIGSVRSTSEALLIKCALSVLSELGYKDLYIEINSIGDRESIMRFERELGTYFRKGAPTLTAKSRGDFKKNPYEILTDASESNAEFRAGAPQTIGSLSDIGRVHFKEVLESLEAFEVTYNIKPHVLSNKLYASNTVFEIRDGKNLLAFGYRYNHLAKKIGHKREIPSVGLSLFVKKSPAQSKKILIHKIKKPQFYLVQLGNAAKLKALNVVEMLRKEKLPVYHSITKDKMTGQLSGAEYMKATHVLVMGQKEAIDNTVIVRSVSTREQETVNLDKLAEFLKDLDKPVKNKKKK